MEQQFTKILQDKVAEIEGVIGNYLPKESGYSKTVLEAMNYSVLSGGKRIRPMLMLETFKMFGGKGKEIEAFMTALEMIHTYSLVHDDLPAMDNDEYRRGRKTTHVVYGESMAILAGDALLNYAFEVAMSAFPLHEDMEEEKYSIGKMQAIARAAHVLASKAGIFGMIGGQTADIEAETQKSPVTTEQLLFIHENKTAALLQAGMMIGAILAGASETEVDRVEECAYKIGIAFQIQDDILDIIGNSDELGKAIGSDAKNNKQTYATINGLEKSQADVALLSQEAIDILNGFDGDSEFLRQLVHYLIQRHK